MPALVSIQINTVDMHRALFFTHSVSLSRLHTHTHTQHTRRERERELRREFIPLINQLHSKSPAQFLMVNCIFVYFTFHGPNKVTIIKTLLKKKT